MLPFYAHIPIVSNYTLKPPHPFPVHFRGIQPDSFLKKHTFSKKKYRKKLEPPKRRQVNSTPCAVFWKITTWNVPTLPGERQWKWHWPVQLGTFFYASGGICEFNYGYTIVTYLVNLLIVIFHWLFFMISWCFHGDSMDFAGDFYHQT